MTDLPNDPVILLSFVNTKLRDQYANLDALAEALETDRGAIEEKLSAINYVYDAVQNQFI